MFGKNRFLEAKLGSWDVPSGIFIIYFENQKVELKNCSRFGDLTCQQSETFRWKSSLVSVCSVRSWGQGAVSLA